VDIKAMALAAIADFLKFFILFSWLMDLVILIWGL
jgi:hypothetical protein